MDQQINEFLSNVEAEKSFSTNTIAAYGNDLAQFCRFISVPSADNEFRVIDNWSQLSGDQLQRYVDYLQRRDYALSTIARKTAAVKSFSHYLVQHGFLTDDPATSMTSPKVGKYSPKPVPPDQVAKLLAQALCVGQAGRPETLRDHAMLETLYATGMRVSELVALDAEDIDANSSLIHCRGKAGRARDLPLSEVWAALSHYLDAGRPKLAMKEEPALFVNQRGTRLTRQGFWLILKSYAQAAGVHEITPHALRHAFAWNALHGGASLRQVQEMLGHVSISTTKVYRRVQPEEGYGTGSSNGDKLLEETQIVLTQVKVKS